MTFLLKVSSMISSQTFWHFDILRQAIITRAPVGNADHHTWVSFLFYATQNMFFGTPLNCIRDGETKMLYHEVHDINIEYQQRSERVSLVK